MARGCTLSRREIEHLIIAVFQLQTLKLERSLCCLAIRFDVRRQQTLWYRLAVVVIALVAVAVVALIALKEGKFILRSIEGNELVNIKGSSTFA